MIGRWFNDLERTHFYLVVDDDSHEVRVLKYYCDGEDLGELTFSRTDNRLWYDLGFRLPTLGVHDDR